MKLAELTSPEVAKCAGKTVAILPLAAIEQHGPHLAVSTDTVLVTHLAEQIEAARKDKVVLCPTQCYGASDHHLDFAGTLSLPADVFTNVVIALTRSLIKSGFQRIVLLNGHGGNIVPTRQALALMSREFTQQHIALATYWEVANFAPLETPALSHACEYETSLMLEIFPAGVHLDRAKRAKRPPKNAYIAWEDEAPYRGVSMFKPTKFISSNGSSGDPTKATKQKGQLLQKHAVAALLEFVDSFQTWPVMEELS